MKSQRKRIWSALLGACIVLSLSAAGAESTAEAATLTVIGTAEVVVAADYATLTLGVSTTAETVAEASASNSTSMTTLLAALEEAGIAKEDMVTENFSVSPVYNYSYGKLGESQSITGYQVENRLRVTVRDLSTIGTVLDAGMKAGANEAFDITFLSSKSVDAQDEALKAAIAEGQRKAALMAEACGGTLGSLVSAAESYVSGTGVTLRYATASDAGTSILPDDLSVSAEVTLVFKLEKE